MKKNINGNWLISGTLLAAFALIYVQSCTCDTFVYPAKTPAPGNPGDPKLPAIPFDYVGTRYKMPGHIADFLLQFPAIDNTPGNNAITNTGATLGRVLFYDKSLSINNKTACASCHHQDKAFTDGLGVSEGFNGGKTRRNSMPIVNVRFFRDKTMFWDMRAASLEKQATMPILDHIEMGMPSIAALETKLRTISYYPALFNAAFGTNEITGEKVERALSQFMRSIVSFDSRYDEGLANDFADFTPTEKNGMRIFNSKFCTECHSDLHHIGLRQHPSFLVVENSGKNTGFGSNNGLNETYSDNGIGEITLKPEDQGTFKIPSMRNVALTGPYMHDGRFATLEQVLDHYASGIKKHPNMGIQMRIGGIPISDTEKREIIAFLKTLSGTTLMTDAKYADPFK